MEQRWGDSRILVENKKLKAPKSFSFFTKALLVVLFFMLLYEIRDGTFSEEDGFEFTLGEYSIGTLSKIRHKQGERFVFVIMEIPYKDDSGHSRIKSEVLQVSDLRFISANHIKWLDNEFAGRTCSAMILSLEKGYLPLADIYCQGAGNLADFIKIRGMGH